MPTFEPSKFFELAQHAAETSCTFMQEHGWHAHLFLCVDPAMNIMAVPEVGELYERVYEHLKTRQPETSEASLRALAEEVHKDMMTREVRRFAERIGAQGVIHVAEAWAFEVTPEEVKAPGFSPRAEDHQERRQEVLSIVAITRRETRQYTQRIVRDDRGRVLRLEKWPGYGLPVESSGRMTELLPAGN